MTQQDKRTKWLCYALAVLPVWLLEAQVLSRLPLFGVVPVLLPLAAMAAGLFEGSSAGAWFGLGVGILADAVYPGVPGGMTLGLALLGWLAGVFSEHGIDQTFPGCLICSSVGFLLLELCRTLFAGFTALGAWSAVSFTALKEGLWSLCFTPVVYLFFRFVYRRVGGQKLGG